MFRSFRITNRLTERRRPGWDFWRKRDASTVWAARTSRQKGILSVLCVCSVTPVQPESIFRSSSSSSSSAAGMSWFCCWEPATLWFLLISRLSVVSISDLPPRSLSLICTLIRAPLGRANFIKVVSWIKNEGVYFALRSGADSWRRLGAVRGRNVTTGNKTSADPIHEAGGFTGIWVCKEEKLRDFWNTTCDCFRLKSCCTFITFKINYSRKSFLLMLKIEGHKLYSFLRDFYFEENLNSMCQRKLMCFKCLNLIKWSCKIKHYQTAQISCCLFFFCGDFHCDEKGNGKYFCNKI